MSEQNKNLVRRYFEEVINQGKLAVADELFDSGYTHHDPVNPGIRGPEGIKQLISKYRTAFPDIRLDIQEIFDSGENVVVRYTGSGTQKGVLEGVPPTNKRVQDVQGITICHCARGKIQKGFIAWDALGLMRQLGVVPQQAQARGAAG